MLSVQICVSVVVLVFVVIVGMSILVLNDSIYDYSEDMTNRMTCI